MAAVRRVRRYLDHLASGVRPRTRCWLLLSLALAWPMASAAAKPAGAGGELLIPVWDVLYGGFRQVEDVAVVSDAEAWGIDAMLLRPAPATEFRTAMVHRLGNVWRVRQVLDGVRLVSIAMAGPTFGMAVGDGGTIVRYDGHRWWPMASPTRLNLVDVALAGPDNGWAVGELGALLRWDGSNWTVTEPPTLFAQFVGLTMPSAEEAWAATALGQVFHYHDGRWQSEAIEPAQRLERVAGIAFASPRRGMVYGYGATEYRDGRWVKVADDSTSIASLAWHGDVAYAVVESQLMALRGDVWEPLTADLPEGYALSDLSFLGVAAATDGVWALADSGIVVWLSDGPPVHLWPAALTLRDIELDAEGDGWAGGRALGSAFVGSAQGTWRLTVSDTLQAEVLDLELVGDSDGWAVGSTWRDGGRELPALWRYDGHRWRSMAIDKTWQLRGVEARAADDVWLAGGDLVAHFDGSEWRLLPDPPLREGTGALAVVGEGEPDVWFGGTGQLFRLRGTEWTTVTLAVPQPVLSVAMASPDEGWAATAGALMHYDGQGWALHPVPLQPGESIRDLVAPRPTEPWLLLDPPALLGYWTFGWRRYDLSLLGVVEPNALQVRPLDEPEVTTEVWLAGGRPSVVRLRLVAPFCQLALPALWLNASR